MDKAKDRAYRLARGEQVTAKNPKPKTFIDWKGSKPVDPDKVFEGCKPIPGEQQAPDC